MTPEVGDWVRYKHVSGTIIMGEVTAKKGRALSVRDRLGLDVVSIKQVMEIRPAKQRSET